jgi:hypothetical protein
MPRHMVKSSARKWFGVLVPTGVVVLACLATWVWAYYVRRSDPRIYWADLSSTYAIPAFTAGLITVYLAWDAARQQRAQNRAQQIAETHAKVDRGRAAAIELTARITRLVYTGTSYDWLDPNGSTWNGVHHAWRMVRDMSLEERDRFYRRLEVFAEGMRRSPGEERHQRGQELIDVVAELQEVLAEFDFWCARLREQQPEDLESLKR